MSPSADHESEKDPLKSVLRDVEAELRDRLREACDAEANGLATESASEIRHLEDSLLAAAVAAEQTIALRRHIEQRQSAKPEQADEPAAVPNEPADSVIAVREFRDAQGHLWRAWPVTPGQARHSQATERYLGEFHKGWICFEALEGSARRRLPGRPAGWSELQEPELCRLLDQAINAPQRKSNEAGEHGRPRIR